MRIKMDKIRTILAGIEGLEERTKNSDCSTEFRNGQNIAYALVKELIYQQFPELAESEDEMIRHCIEVSLSDVDEQRFKDFGTTLKDCLAYLEKQKVNTDGDFARGYDCGYECCLNSHGAEWFEKQKDPHYTKRNALFDKCVENCDQEVMKSVSDEVDEMLEKEQKPLSTEETELNSIAFLEQLGYTCVPPGAEQKPAEWSEEDEKVYNNALDAFYYKDCNDKDDVLFALKDLIDLVSEIGNRKRK